MEIRVIYLSVCSSDVEGMALMCNGLAQQNNTILAMLWLQVFLKEELQKSNWLRSRKKPHEVVHINS